MITETMTDGEVYGIVKKTLDKYLRVVIDYALPKFKAKRFPTTLTWHREDIKNNWEVYIIYKFPTKQHYKNRMAGNNAIDRFMKVNSLRVPVYYTIGYAYKGYVREPVPPFVTSYSMHLLSRMRERNPEYKDMTDIQLMLELSSICATSVRTKHDQNIWLMGDGSVVYAKNNWDDGVVHFFTYIHTSQVPQYRYDMTDQEYESLIEQRRRCMETEADYRQHVDAIQLGRRLYTLINSNRRM